MSAGAVGKFVFVLGPGALQADSGTETATHGTRNVRRGGQDVTIQSYVTTREGKRGAFVVRFEGFLAPG